MDNHMKTKDIRVECSEKSVKINGTEISFPLHMNTLVKLFGDPSLMQHDLLWNVAWDDYGIWTDYGTADNILNINFLIKETDRFTYLPQKLFPGSFLINGRDFSELEEDECFLKKNHARKIRYRGEGEVLGFALGQNFDYKEDIPPDKYRIEKESGEVILFKDFNFKLAVIQVLMYEKELLKPKFDLSEFVKWYDKRKIDPDKEGYELIPEVTQYFKDLPIPKKLAGEITEIYQDGGDEIYLNMLPGGSGSEDYFDIRTAEDAGHFPRLKKATICYAKENVIDELKEMGIEAEWL